MYMESKSCKNCEQIFTIFKDNFWIEKLVCNFRYPFNFFFKRAFSGVQINHNNKSDLYITEGTLTTLRRLTFIHAKLCLTDLRLTSLTKSGVRLCGPDDVYFRHVWPGTRAVYRFLCTDFLGVHGMSRLDTRQQWTSSHFSWILCLIPLSKTCSFYWLGWNFYRQINLHCHEVFLMKGGSHLFDWVLIPGHCVTGYDGMVSGEEKLTHWTN